MASTEVGGECCNDVANAINAELDAINVVMQDILGQRAALPSEEDIKEPGGAIGLLDMRLYFALRACEKVLTDAKVIQQRLGPEVTDG